MPLTYISRTGGKYRLRKHIVSLFPDYYTCYVEPFCGGAQVFLELENKEHNVYVLNDANKDIYDLWNDLKQIDRDQFLQMDFTVQDKQLFDELKQQTNIQNIKDRLYRNLYLSLYSYSHQRKAFAQKPTTKGHHLFRHFNKLKEKLEGVVILNKDYKDVMKQNDSPYSLFYIDPPYFGMEKYYEGQSVDPFELAEVCSNLQGKFILSYNDVPQVKEAFAGFNINTIPLTYVAGRKSKKATELLISNF